MNKEIRQESDIVSWEQSIAYRVLIDFLSRCNDNMRGISNADPEGSESHPINTQAVQSIVKLLHDCMLHVQLVPLISLENSRFGNPAFRCWMNQIKQKMIHEWKESIGNLISSHELPEYACPGLIDELSEYFENSLGSAIRLDYGTGHELSFLAFLCCCEKMQFWKVSQSGYVVNVLFRKYVPIEY